MSGLFRPEALKHRDVEWLGSIQLIRPVTLSVLTGFCVCVALSVGVFLYFGEYTRKAHLSGSLVPDLGIIRLVSPQAGTVLESHVAEGGNVHRGDHPERRHPGGGAGQPGVASAKPARRIAQA